MVKMNLVNLAIPIFLLLALVIDYGETKGYKKPILPWGSEVDYGTSDQADYEPESVVESVPDRWETDIIRDLCPWSV